MIGVALGELDIGKRAGEHIIRMTGMGETEAEARMFQTRVRTDVTIRTIVTKCNTSALQPQSGAWFG